MPINYSAGIDVSYFLSTFDFENILTEPQT
jgi:hypothetical protein